MRGVAPPSPLGHSRSWHACIVWRRASVHGVAPHWSAVVTPPPIGGATPWPTGARGTGQKKGRGCQPHVRNASHHSPPGDCLCVERHGPRLRSTGAGSAAARLRGRRSLRPPENAGLPSPWPDRHRVGPRAQTWRTQGHAMPMGGGPGSPPRAGGKPQTEPPRVTLALRARAHPTGQRTAAWGRRPPHLCPSGSCPRGPCPLQEGVVSEWVVSEGAVPPSGGGRVRVGRVRGGHVRGRGVRGRRVRGVGRVRVATHLGYTGQTSAPDTS